MRKRPRKKNLIQSFNNSVNGIIYALKNELNMRVHLIAAFLVFILSLFYSLSRIEIMLLSFAVALVFMAELFNTAIERTVDLVTEEYRVLAKVAKDVAAGGVLVAAVNSVIVGYLVFFDKVNPLTRSVLFRLRHSSVHLTFIALALVLLSTLGLKSLLYRGRGTHFQGGTVSGHTSLAFCIATIITFLSSNVLVATLSFIMAILVAESRVEGKIHTVLEVISGAFVGIFIGILVFQLIG